MVDIKFSQKELQRFTKRVRYCSRFGQQNSKRMVSIHKRVGKIYVKAARGMINDSENDVKVYYRGGVRTVERGTLRRSMGTWKTRRGESNVFAGPRSGHVQRSVANTNRDGWHQFIADGGYSGTSSKRNTKNRGVFAKALSQTRGLMQTVQFAEYRNEFNKYMR